MKQSSRNNENESKAKTTRRDFGRGALWIAPTLTVLLAASTQPAAAIVGVSGGLGSTDPN